MGGWPNLSWKKGLLSKSQSIELWKQRGLGFWPLSSFGKIWHQSLVFCGTEGWEGYRFRWIKPRRFGSRGLWKSLSLRLRKSTPMLLLRSLIPSLSTTKMAFSSTSLSLSLSNNSHFQVQGFFCFFRFWHYVIEFMGTLCLIEFRGHGTSELNGEISATICGIVERVNKLVYVRSLRARYSFSLCPSCSILWNFASCQCVLAELVELLGTSQMLEIS